MRAMQEPKVGERRATTEFAHAAAGDQPTDAPPDSTWTVEEWDGIRWRKVGSARGERDRDRLLKPEQAN